MTEKSLSIPGSPDHPAPSLSSSSNRKRLVTSCLTCRRRKVRCDRERPVCSACLRGGHSCHYEAQAASSSSMNRVNKSSPEPRQHQRQLDVKARLERLEELLEQVAGASRHNEQEGPRDTNLMEVRHNGSLPDQIPRQLPDGPETERIDDRSGALVLEEGRSHFVSPLYFALLGEQVHDLKLLLDDQNEMDEPHSAQDADNLFLRTEIPHTFPSVLFGSHLTYHDLSVFYPDSAEDCFLLLDTFFTNVDPIIRLVHGPTLRARFELFRGSYNPYHAAISMSAISSDTPTKQSFEPLAFAVFLSALNSMPPELVAQEFGTDKNTLLDRFRKGVELALAKADFISSPETEVLQAFVLVLCCFCKEDDMLRAWSLTGLAIKNAQTLGLHREPMLFPSEAMDEIQVEIRRRLWHQICVLDFRTAEAQGQEPSISDDAFDTLLPNNIDDEELIKGRQAPSGVRDAKKFTGMTMQLVRLNAIHAYRKLFHAIYALQNWKRKPGSASNSSASGLNSRHSLAAEEDRVANGMRLLVKELTERNQNLYLRYCDPNIPVHRITLALGKVVEWKFWVMFNHRFSSKDREKTMSLDMRIKTFTTAVLLLENLQQAASDSGTIPFRWHIDSHTAFHAATYILTELCSPAFQRPELRDSWNRGWHSVENIRELHRENKGKPWRMLRRMIASAEKFQESQQLAAKRGQVVDSPAVGLDGLHPNVLGMADYPFSTDMASNIPSSIDPHLLDNSEMELDFVLLINSSLVFSKLISSQEFWTPYIPQYDGLVSPEMQF